MASTVKFWVNAFIPISVCELHGDTYAVEVNGNFVAAVGWPFPHTWYLAGDQRSFSSDIHASARMHSEVEIQGVDSDPRTISLESHICGESLALDVDGNIVLRDTASTDQMGFANLRRNQSVDPEGGVVDDSPNPNLVQIDANGTASVPFPVAPFVPAIDYSGTFSFDPDSGEARFRGGTDGFPAYEFYVVVDNGDPVLIGNFEPISPFELVGDAERPVDISVTVPALAPN